MAEQTLQELFDMDPLKLTKEHRATIIAKYRESWTQFMQGIKAPKEKKGPVTPINLDDLDV